MNVAITDNRTDRYEVYETSTGWLRAVEEVLTGDPRHTAEAVILRFRNGTVREHQLTHAPADPA
ncbi:MAG: hypothetical protein ACXVGB_00200 [Mycobacteriaceae bacterium]